ncbi:hypothetical protein [Nocardia sp. SSK8]|uniref:hypothetical protein n=1 Tax=Nocardia sp. SSK8 TaxID=3120154 RepID=UPI003009FC50
MTYEEYRDRIIAAQEQWNSDRNSIYLVQSMGQFASVFDGAMQPQHINMPDSYDHMTLAEMVQAVSEMKPSAAGNASAAWKSIGDNLSKSLDTFNQAFSQAVTSGWTGVAAEAAVAAVSRYAQQSKALPLAATAISLKLAELQTGIEQTQALMPGLTQRPDIAGKELPGDGVMKAGDYTEEEATQEARRILRTVYGQVAVQADAGVPFVPGASSITAGEDPGNGGGPASAGPGTSSKPEQRGDSGDPQTPAEDPGASEDPALTDPGASSPDVADESSGDTTEGLTGDDGTTAQSAAAPSSAPPSVAPNTTSPAAPGSGAPGGGPAGGGVAGGIGAVGHGASTSGRGVPGTPVAEKPAAASSGNRVASPGSGRAGMAGIPGMGAPGAGRGRSEEAEHKGTPEYLITQEHGDQVTGIDTQGGVVPPVIGGDYESADR